MKKMIKSLLTIVVNWMISTKSGKSLFEYIFNRKLAKKLLPPKAFMRLFSDKDDFFIRF